MHASAKTLLPFKNYNYCYDELIKRCVEDWFLSEDVFRDIVPACTKMQELASKVFENNAEHVLVKFVSFIFDKKLQGYVVGIICYFHIILVGVLGAVKAQLRTGRIIPVDVSVFFYSATVTTLLYAMTLRDLFHYLNEKLFVCNSP